MEHRHSLHLRAEGSTLVGYAAVFHERATLGSITESMHPGAFRESLAGNDIVCLMDHDQGKLLGRTRTGTLTLKEDTKGLAFALHLPETSLGRDVLVLASRGDLGGCSVGFHITAERWQGSHRVLDKVDLREISLVSSWPAYPGTSVKPRSSGMSLALRRRWVDTL